VNDLFVHQGLLVGRSLLLLVGIVSANSVLMGAFEVMLCSGRDEEEHHGMGKIVGGIAGTFIVAALFLSLTVALEKL
jgi:hypothetical protein